MKIAYMTPQYPKVSHTFIRREIVALETRGHSVVRLTIRKSDLDVVVDPADRAELDRTIVVLAGTAPLVAAVLMVLATRPLRAVAVAANALRVGLRSGSGLVRPVAYFVEACRLLRLCAEEEIQHVHVHFGTNAATVAMLARRLGGPTFSVAIHGPDEWDAPERHLIADKIREGAFTTVISAYARAQAQRWSRPEDWPRLHEVHCTVDEAFFEAASPIEDDPEIRFVCVGRLTPQKGPHLLVDAFARLIEEGANARLVLAGDGELRDEVEARIASHSLGDRVRITGWISEAEVRRELAASHCLVLPSSAEGLPVVIMEAFALGRPVLSTFVAGIPELVRPGENGWLVPAGDVDALVATMREIVKTPVDELRRRGEEGARAVRERHTAATEGPKVDALIRASRGEGS